MLSVMTQLQEQSDRQRRRAKLRRSRAALLSGLRRYPPELLGSLLKRDELSPASQPLLADLQAHHLAVCWLGHGSVLAKLGEVTLAVDPVLSPRVGPRIAGRIWGPVRRQTPPAKAAALRGLDLVLITHAHYDHLDRDTLAQLASPATTIVVPERCARLIPKGFGKVVPLRAPDEVVLHGVKIAGVKPRHWGARTWLDRRRGFNAYVVRHARGSLLLTGDTAMTDAFDDLGPVDLAVFGIGAYDPWDHMHATPEEVWRMFDACGAERLLPVHHSTFILSDEPVDEPMQRLTAAAGEERGRIVTASAGEVVVW